jgi:hypothetical protein
MVRMLIVPLSLGWGALAWQLIAVPVQSRAASALAPVKRMQLG